MGHITSSILVHADVITDLLSDKSVIAISIGEHSYVKRNDFIVEVEKRRLLPSQIDYLYGFPISTKLGGGSMKVSFNPNQYAANSIFSPYLLPSRARSHETHS